MELGVSATRRSPQFLNTDEMWTSFIWIVFVLYFKDGRVGLGGRFGMSDGCYDYICKQN